MEEDVGKPGWHDLRSVVDDAVEKKSVLNLIKLKRRPQSSYQSVNKGRKGGYDGVVAGVVAAQQRTGSGRMDDSSRRQQLVMELWG